MGQKRITVTIKKGGSLEVATDGFSGKECKDATKALEKALGSVTEDNPTQEMHQTAGNSNTQSTSG